MPRTWILYYAYTSASSLSLSPLYALSLVGNAKVFPICYAAVRRLWRRCFKYSTAPLEEGDNMPLPMGCGGPNWANSFFPFFSFFPYRCPPYPRIKPMPVFLGKCSGSAKVSWSRKTPRLALRWLQRAENLVGKRRRKKGGWKKSYSETTGRDIMMPLV